MIVTVRATRPSSRDLTSPQDAKFCRGGRGRPHRLSNPRRLRARVRHPVARVSMSTANTHPKAAPVTTVNRCAPQQRAAL